MPNPMTTHTGSRQDEHVGSPVIGLAFLALLYPLLDWVSYIYPMAQFNVTPWNPQPSLAIAFLMIHGQRWLPAVMVIVTGTDYLIRDGSTLFDGRFIPSLVLSLCFGAIAALLTQRYRISPRLDSTRDVLRLMLIVILGTLITGVVYVAALFVGGSGTTELFSQALIRFWIGDSVGILVFLPLVLMMSDALRRRELQQLLLRPESIAQGALIALVLLFVFGQDAEEQVKYFYLTFLPLVWISARSGLIGSAMAALLIQTGVIAGVHFTDQPTLTIFQLQSFLIALTIMGLFLGITVDEREQAEKALRESQRLMAAGQMAATLTHELSQPITAVVNYARAGQLMMMANDPDRGRLEDTMQKLVIESRRTADTVRRLRDFLQQSAMQLDPVNVVDLIKRIETSMANDMASAGVQLQVVVDAKRVVVIADAVQIEIVLRNLLRNSIDALMTNTDSRQIQVRLQDAGHSLRVSVIDNGPGIHGESKERIFEPFATSKVSGMGMGLAISRAIIEAHEGRLWAEAGDCGTICLTLPFSESDHE